MNTTALLQLLAVFGFTLAAMVTDLKWRRIPNWLTVSAAALGLVFHVATGGMNGLLFALGGFAVGFGFLLVLWLIGGGGGGDVKLMGAVGAWIGAQSTLFVFVLSALMGFLCLVVMMGWRLFASKPVSASSGAASSNIAGQASKIAGGANSVFQRTIPYAVPAGLSAWAVLLAKMFVSGV